ncbi:MAG: ABC transporter permease [Ruminococcus sp.]|nr:ABC transporter permease [Ruminococcus sp.]
MRLKIRKHQAVIAGINAASVIGILALTAAGSHIARSQGYNYSARKWDSSGGSTQISCFLSEENGFNTDGVQAVRSALTKKLEEASLFPEEGKSLFNDAYSTPAGTVQLRSEGRSRCEADLTVVGGDFFFFRDFRLLSGAYFTERDLMQDGAVIDRSLAWSLFGSDNVAGMKISINDRDFYVAGVIAEPSTEEEKYCDGDMPKVYISYTGAEIIGLSSDDSMMYYGEEGSDAASKFTDVSTYECISPDPVENFTLNTLKKHFNADDSDSIIIVDNTHRFSPSALAKKYRKRWKAAVLDSKLTLPWWENASRIAEYKLSPIYFFRRLLFIPPVLTALWILYLIWRFISRNKGKFISAVIDKIYQINYNRHLKKKQKEVK